LFALFPRFFFVFVLLLCPVSIAKFVANWCNG
jgi:hypothetical protein